MPEFPTRQDLSNAVTGSGVVGLIRDGITITEMPDAETRAAWLVVEDLVRDLDEAVEQVTDLLPESVIDKYLRESKEANSRG